MAVRISEQITPYTYEIIISQVNGTTQFIKQKNRKKQKTEKTKQTKQEKSEVEKKHENRQIIDDCRGIS